jgi:hypothetical protein
MRQLGRRCRKAGKQHGQAGPGQSVTAQRRKDWRRAIRASMSGELLSAEAGSIRARRPLNVLRPGQLPRSAAPQCRRAAGGLPMAGR